MPRPPLGVLRLSTGDVVTLDRSVLLGRAPRLSESHSAADRPHVVKVPSPERDVSRNHVEVVLEGWHVLIRDLGTTNGTTVSLPGETAVRLPANDQQVLEPGSVVSMADEISFVFETANLMAGSRRGAAGRTNPRTPPKIPGLVFVQPLGSGGYADVFLYEQQSPRMPVAVKVLKAEGLTDTLREQFVEEADTMAALGDHPYIVQVFRAGTSDDGRPYLVMKYYPPPNLAMRARAERFSVEEVLRTGIQLASAVETAHRAHITHRDIKPANVLVSAYGAPGLTDFGIAGRGARDGETPPEATDDVGVSVPWAPPEVLYGQSNGDERADVYSLAATLWQLLVGRSPFEVPGGDNSAYALMPRIRSTPPPSTGRPDVPAGLERLLAQAMAKDPARRPATALELARALQSVEQDQRLARTPIVVLDEQGHTTLVSQTQGSPTGLATDDDRTRVKAPQTVHAQPAAPPRRPAPEGPTTDVDDETRRRGPEPAGRHSPSPMPSPPLSPVEAPSAHPGDAGSVRSRVTTEPTTSHTTPLGARGDDESDGATVRRAPAVAGARWHHDRHRTRALPRALRRRAVPARGEARPDLRWCGRSPPESRCCSPSWPLCCSGRPAAALQHPTASRHPVPPWPCPLTVPRCPTASSPSRSSSRAPARASSPSPGPIPRRPRATPSGSTSGRHRPTPTTRSEPGASPPRSRRMPSR